MKEAVAKAFSAKEVAGFFEAQEPITLRGRLREVLTKGKGLEESEAQKEALEILTRLKAIDSLKADEEELFETLRTASMSAEFHMKKGAKGKSKRNLRKANS